MNRGITYSACLRGASYRHCFISFPHHWRAFITPATVPTFIVESIERSIVVSWAGHTHDQDNDDEVFVCLNSKLLSANEFSEGQAVIVRQVACPSPCTSASMNVLSDSDWEELTLNIDVAQNAFLTQFRVIKKDQVFPLWLEGGLIVYLKVHDCFPSAAVSLLQQNTEVKVEPFHDSSSVIPLAIKPFPREKKYWINHNSEQNNQKYTLKIIYTLFVLLGYGYRTFKNFPKLDVISSLKVLNYSPHPYLKPQSMLLKLLTIHPSIIIASVKNFKRTKVESASHFIATVYKHNNSPDTNSHIVNSSNSEFSQVTGIVAVVMIWEKLKEFLEVDKVYDDMETMLNHKSCIVSSALRRKLVINESSIIVIETLNSPIKSKTFLVDVGTRKACKQLIHSSISASFSELNKICPIVFNDKTQLNLIIEGNSETVLLSTRDGNPVIVEKENITQVFFHFDTIPARQPACEIDDVDENADFDTNFIEEIKVNQEILNELLATIKTDLHLEVTSFSLCPQFILLQGNKSSGKTTLVQRLVTMLRRSPYFVYCHVVSLKTFKGKKVESVQKLLKSAISEALNYKPSLLILDDLDFLTNVNNLEEKGAAFEYVSHMTFMVKNLLGQILEAMKIASRSNAYEDYMTVLATCISRNDVHSLLASSKGNHLFSKSISICPLSEESKLTFVRHCLENMYNMFMKEQKPRWVKNATDNIFTFKTKEIIPKLDNLTLSDIRNLSIRIYLEAKHRWLNDCRFLEDIYMDYNEDCQFSYTDSDILKAYDGFISSSVRALNISNTVRKATKIGGLQEARQTLEEMIIWPSKYPHLFSQTTLRLRSGILLYGPPGCGKSLLAKSFENYPHLNYITVKGPELLSKYIGQSEKAVRDAFERASSAKPCVLFFDEFESIAPRRGHDNTGVTDRVVNQLLTQMDGVEGLSGVYVLAATSRPELIDPALLRPGRLDKGVFCPLPDERDRQDILSLLCEDINLDDLIDIKEIAKRTSGYSGADLQSVLSTALIKAAQTFIGRSLYEAVGEDTDSENISFASEINEMTESVDLKNYNNDTLSFPKEVSDHSSLYVTLEHISEALAEVQPSVTEKERLRYEALYKKFTSNKESNFMTVKPGKKETLA